VIQANASGWLQWTWFKQTPQVDRNNRKRVPGRNGECWTVCPMRSLNFLKWEVVGNTKYDGTNGEEERIWRRKCPNPCKRNVRTTETHSLWKTWAVKSLRALRDFKFSLQLPQCCPSSEMRERVVYYITDILEECIVSSFYDKYTGLGSSEGLDYFSGLQWRHVPHEGNLR